MVLAGGEGKRLMPLTADRAKPAVPFGGSYRLVDFVLSNLINAGLRRVCVLTQYKSHSLDRHITQTWRGKPLTSRETIVELIASTTTKTGLTVRCELDTRIYPKGLKVEDADMATLNIKGDAFHPEWNYTIAPRVPQ